MRSDRQLDILEMVLRKMGHQPYQALVSQGKQMPWRPLRMGLVCGLCGYVRGSDSDPDEDDVEPCMVATSSEMEQAA